MSDKVSIRFFNDRQVRAIWDDDNSKWWFSVLDIIGVLNAQDDYTKNRNYWKYLKTKLRQQNNEVVSATNQLKLLAPDGKKRLTDVLDMNGVLALAQCFPNNRVSSFLDWFTYSDNTRCIFVGFFIIIFRFMQNCCDNRNFFCYDLNKVFDFFCRLL